MKRLENHSAIAAFDSEIRDGVERGVWRLATADDLNYAGPVNYIILTEAYKENIGARTPVRVCLERNTALPSITYWSTGPNKLACQLRILLNIF